MASQTRHPWKATARTILSTVVAIAAGMPLIITAITDRDPELATGAGATALVVAGIVTRLMAVPVVNDVLTLVGLGAEPRHAEGGEIPENLRPLGDGYVERDRDDGPAH